MEILIVGSLRAEDTGHKCKGQKDKDEYDVDQKYVDNNMKRFEDTCKALGKELVDRGYTIRTGVATWEMLTKRNTVATFLPLGANESSKKMMTQKKLSFISHKSLSQKIPTQLKNQPVYEN